MWLSCFIIQILQGTGLCCWARSSRQVYFPREGKSYIPETTPQLWNCFLLGLLGKESDKSFSVEEWVRKPCADDSVKLSLIHPIKYISVHTMKVYCRTKKSSTFSKQLIIILSTNLMEWWWKVCSEVNGINSCQCWIICLAEARFDFFRHTRRANILRSQNVLQRVPKLGSILFLAFTGWILSYCLLHYGQHLYLSNLFPLLRP